MRSSYSGLTVEKYCNPLIIAQHDFLISTMLKREMARPGSDHAYVVDWIQDPATPGEIHASAIQLNDKTGFYEKCLIRVEFPDFAYLLFAEDPEMAMIDRARKVLGGSAVMRMNKVKTIAGYQPEPTVPALVIKSPDLNTVFKTPEIKALGGYVEEHTVITRSRKITALRGMSQCCWIPLAGFSVVSEADPIRLSKTRITEYKIPSWEKLSSIPLDSREAFIPPPSEGVKVVSFDIEVYKPSERGGGMPDPKDKSNFVLCISQITHEQSSLASLGEKRTILHTIYDVKEIFENTKIIRYATEYEMIRGFWDQVAAEDPVLILGFNIMGHDFRYLHARMKLHGITYPSALSIYKRPERIIMKKNHWGSEAYKYNDIQYPDIPGIVILDLHKFYLRSRPQLRKFSLDFISRHFLGRGKLDMSQSRMAAAIESGDQEELSAVAAYNILDSQLVLDLYLSQSIFTEAALEAFTSEVLISELYTKGMQIRALNKLYRYAKEANLVFTTSPALSISRGQGGKLVGALVQGAEPGRYDDVAIFDIRSMYPTIMMSRNICYTTYLNDDDDEKIPHTVYPWETRIGMAEDSTRETHKASFVKPEVKVGICTQLLADQIELRERIKSWGNKEAQRAVKLVSNALIGLLASSFENARLSFPAAAGVVYTAGRGAISEIIQDVSQCEVTSLDSVVYSDTDSIFVSGLKTAEGRQILLQYLNGKYSPFVFELEGAGRLLLVGPKNYIFRLETDGSLIYKSLMFSRKNSSDFVSQTMRHVTEMIMTGDRPRADIIAYVKEVTDNIQLQDVEEFVMSAKVSLAGTSIGGRLGRRLNAGGAHLMPGDEIEYVVVNDKKAKGKKAGVTERTMTVEELMENPDVELDYSYYVDKLRTSVDQLLVFT